MIRVQNLLSQQYLLNRNVLFSYLDRAVSAKFDESAKMSGDDSVKMCFISEKLTSQRNELIQQKIRCVSKNFLSYQNA